MVSGAPPPQECSPSVETEPFADKQGGQKVSARRLGSGSTSAGHSSVWVVAGGLTQG